MREGVENVFGEEAHVGQCVDEALLANHLCVYCFDGVLV
jgi:hypothetical protein